MQQINALIVYRTHGRGEDTKFYKDSCTVQDIQYRLREDSSTGKTDLGEDTDKLNIR
jgi:hypothetical protein